MAGYAPLPQYQYPANALIDFSPVNQGINALGDMWKNNRRVDQFEQGLASAAGMPGMRPEMMDLARSLGPEHGPNALFQAYNAAQARAAQEAQSRATQAHNAAVLAETQRYHSGSLDLARQRMNMLDSRVRELRGINGDGSPNGLDPTSFEDQIGADREGGFYIRKPQGRAMPTSSSMAPQPSRPSIGMGMQGGGQLPVDRVETQGSFLPTAGDTPMPGVSVGFNPGFHPGAKAMARQEAQQILDTTDLQRLDPKMPQHMMIIQKLGDAYGGGKLDKGKRWTLDANNRLTQEDIPGATKLTAGERKGEAMAVMGLRALEQAERQLVGTVGKKDGEYVPEGTPGIPGWKQMAQGPISLPVVGQITEGFGDTLRAMKSARSAVTALNFYMSGAGVSNQEREHFLDLYMPKSTDSRDTQAWKVGRLKDYFKIVRTVRDGVNDGSAAEQIQAHTREMIDGASRREPAAAPSTPKGPAAGRYRYDPASGEMRPY